jgi:SAM-dependent methyltransferase
MPTAVEARQWLARWDRQQEFYIADREERFTVIADVVAASVDRSDPIVIDLGAGPGSLSVRLLDRLPGAEVVAVDADPMLLGLARAAYGDTRGLTIVEHDLRDRDWVAALGLDRPAEAVVSTTALHWLTESELAAVYRASAALLRPGGVLIDGDNFGEPADHPRLGALARRVRDARGQRLGVLDHEDWRSWWDAAAAAPELADLAAARGIRPLDHSVPVPPTLDDHIRLLRSAGFAEVGTVWQHGDDRVLVAVR